MVRMESSVDLTTELYAVPKNSTEKELVLQNWYTGTSTYHA